MSVHISEYGCCYMAGAGDTKVCVKATNAATVKAKLFNLLTEVTGWEEVPYHSTANGVKRYEKVFQGKKATHVAVEAESEDGLSTDKRDAKKCDCANLP